MKVTKEEKEKLERIFTELEKALIFKSYNIETDGELDLFVVFKTLEGENTLKFENKIDFLKFSDRIRFINNNHLFRNY